MERDKLGRFVLGCRYSDKEKLAMSLNARGANNPNWKGGIRKAMGYIYVYMPNHPKAHRGYVKRANIVMEETTGKYPQKNEVVHHIDGNYLNDAFENLWIMTKSEHCKMHAKNNENLQNYYKTKIRKKAGKHKCKTN